MSVEAWIAAGLAIVMSVVGYLVRSKITDIARESSESVAGVKAIQATMLRPSDLENAVLRMAVELRRQFSEEFYTRREGEQLERFKGG